MRSLLFFSFILILCSCGGSTSTTRASDANSGTQKVVNDMRFLTESGIDAATLPTELGDSAFELTREQYARLIVPAGPDFEDEIASTKILCARPVDDNIALVVYRQSTGAGGRVLLITYDNNGTVADAMACESWHEAWPADPDASDSSPIDDTRHSITFAGNRHFSVGSELRRAPIDNPDNFDWRVAWHQDYDITDEGVIVFKDIKEDVREGDKNMIDETVVANNKCRSMAIMSKRDIGVMDAWNVFIADAEKAYGGSFQAHKAGIVQSELAMIYDANPQRFLQWLAGHRESAGNRIKDYFVLSEGFIDMRQVYAEIEKIGDPSAREYLKRLVDSW